MNPVTDPELLKQLDAAAPVSDPAILRALNGAPAYKPTLGGALSDSANSALRGVTLGFSDEATAAAAAVLAPAMGYGGGDLTMGQRYDAALQVVRDRAKAFKEANPTGAAVTNIAGMVLPFSMAAKAVAPAKTILGRMRQGGVVGGGAGAVQGFGEGEGGALPRALGAGEQGALGAALGFFGQPLAEGVIGAGQAVYRGVKSLLPGQAARTASTRAEGALSEALARDKMTPEQLRAQVAFDREAGLSPTAADVGGENTKSLARLVGKLPGEGRETMHQFAAARAEDARNAFWGPLLKAFNPESKADVQEAIKARLAKVSDDGYRPVFAEAPTVETTPALEKFLNTELGKQYMTAGLKNLANDTGATVQGLGPQNAVGMTGKNYHLEALHQIRSTMLGDMRTLEMSGKKGTPEYRNLARGADDLRDVLATNKPYATATAEYANEKGIERALNNGAKFMQARPEELRAMLAKMTPAEREAYNAGAFDGIEKITRGGGDQAATFLNRAEMKDRLATIFGPETSEALIAQLSRVSGYAKTGQMLNPRAGSPTAPILADAADQSGGSNALVMALSGRPRDAIEQLGTAAGSTVLGAGAGAGVAGYNSGWDPKITAGGALLGGLAGSRGPSAAAAFRGLNEPARAELARLLTQALQADSPMLSARSMSSGQRALDERNMAQLLARTLAPSLAPRSTPYRE